MSKTFVQNASYYFSDSTIAYGIPMAAGAMTISLFLNRYLTMAAALVLAVFPALIFQNRMDVFLYFFINSVMAVYWLKKTKARKGFVLTGAKLGVLNVFLCIVLNLFQAQLTGTQQCFKSIVLSSP